MLTFRAVMENRRTHIVGPPYDAVDETDPIVDYVLPHLSFALPQARFVPSFGRGWDGRIKMLKRGRVGTGLFLALRDHMEREEGIRFEVEDRRVMPKFKRKDVLWSVREYQNECVRAMQAASNTGGLVLSATGSGKTWIVGLYLRKLIGRAVFIVDELTLLHQAKKELEEVIGEPVGIIGESQWTPQRSTVATVQTLSSRVESRKFREWAKGMQAVIVDEVHVMINKRQEEIVQKIAPLAVFGLTATLELKKAPVRLPAMNLCGPVVFDFPLRRGVAEGILSRGLVVRVLFGPELEETGDPYATVYRDFIVENWERHQLIAAIARAAVSAGHHTVILVEQVKHLKTISDILSDIDHRLAYGAVDADDRRRNVSAFEKSKVHLLIANKVFTKGINIKRVSFIIDAASRKDPKDAIQKYGRGVRLSKGKVGLIYIDIADRLDDLIKASQSRRRAFKAAGIQVFSVSAETAPGRIVKLAEAALRKQGRTL